MRFHFLLFSNHACVFGKFVSVLERISVDIKPERIEMHSFQTNELLLRRQMSCSFVAYRGVVKNVDPREM